MAEELCRPSVIMANARWLPPVAGTTLQWDAKSGVCHEVKGPTASEHRSPSTFQLRSAATTALRLPPYWTTGEICLVSGVLLPAVAWKEEATHLALAFNPVLLGDLAQEGLSRATGELLWLPWQEQTASLTPSVSPVLHGCAPAEKGAVELVTIVPVFHGDDPLLTHMALVLQAAIGAKDKEEELYAETLATALVFHFLRRFAATRGTPQRQDAIAGGFVPHKLQRILTYIQAHLDQKMSLMTLATVAQMSPAHFAHLFKQATGLTPHQYVTGRRIEHAKQLLTETALPLIEVGYRIGCADPSHFSALFRQYVGMSPSAYRRNTMMVA